MDSSSASVFLRADCDSAELYFALRWSLLAYSAYYLSKIRIDKWRLRY